LVELISSQDEAQPEANHTVAIRLLARSSEVRERHMKLYVVFN
jgi:hypothetical protein